MVVRSETIELPYFGRLWKPNSKQWLIHTVIEDRLARFSVAYIGVIGASRSSKSVLLVNEVVDKCLRYPSYTCLLSRWTDDSTQSIIRPLFYEIVNDHYHSSILGVPQGYQGPPLSDKGWSAREERQFFTNGSSVYIKGLKCVAPEARVLTADLVWIRANEIVVGTELLAVEEVVLAGGKRHVFPSKVTAVERQRRERVRVVTDKGDVVVSAEHPFLASRPRGRRTNVPLWREANTLQPGDKIKFFSRPWSARRDWKAGWLAGIADGEGSLVAEKGVKLSIAQSEGPLADEINNALQQYGVAARKYGVVVQRKARWQFEFTGCERVARFLGECRPLRLLAKWKQIPRPLPLNGGATVLRVEPISRGSVIAFSTEAKTFVVEGFVSHNSGDDVNRYAKFDGHSLAGVFVSQAEELPKDVFDRLKTRLSLPGFPRLFLFEMNPVMSDHYIWKEFEERSGYVLPADHAFFHVSMYDNAENLPDGYIESMEHQYPPGHPLRHRLIEGKWGLTARGTPIIGSNLFNPDLHIKEIEFDPNWPLLLSYDPGFQHPCLTWAQLDGDNQLRILDCMLGSEIDADSFFFAAFARQNETIGRVKEVRACADKASEQRHGVSTRTEWDIFREHLRPWNVTPLTGIVASKQFLMQRLAARFTRLVRGRPAIVFHPRAEYLIESMMGGWVWRAPTDLRPTPNTPLDNYYAHGADTLTYLEMHFGPGIRAIEKIGPRDDDDRPRPPRRRATASGY